MAGLAFFLSGASALVYQVAWQRILALQTGVGITSIAMIVAAFMAGIGAGSHLGGVLSTRLAPRRALLAFALLEVGIAVFGALSCGLYYDLLYRHGSWLYASPVVGGVLHFAGLLPPTLLMGMSLPFLVRALVDDVGRAGRTVGFLYGVNTLGASVGALLAPWVLMRFFGDPRGGDDRGGAATSSRRHRCSCCCAVFARGGPKRRLPPRPQCRPRGAASASG